MLLNSEALTRTPQIHGSGASSARHRGRVGRGTENRVLLGAGGPGCVPVPVIALGEEGVQRGDGATVQVGVQQGRGVASASTGAPSREPSHLHPHRLPLPHEPPEGGWGVPRLHAPCGFRGLELCLPQLPRSLAQALVWRCGLCLGLLSWQRAETRGGQKPPGPPEALVRVQCVLPLPLHWPEGGVWPGSASPSCRNR